MTEREELRASTFMLPALLESVAESFNLAALHKGLEILLDVAPEAYVEVRGDEAKLREILSQALEEGIAFAQHGAVIIGAGLADWCRHTVTVRFKIVFTFEEMLANLARAQELVACLGGKLSMSADGERGSMLSFAVPLEIVARKAGESALIA